MIFNFPVGELALLAAAIALGGIVTGILAGLFGIGGGAIIVPVLYEVFRILDVPEQVRMQLCVGTSLAIIIPTTIRSYRIHRAKGFALRQVVRQWAPAAIVGVAVGAAIAAFAPAALFKLAFALIAAVIACKILLGGDRWRLGRDLPSRLAMTGYGFLIGLCSSLMGVSGGSISNMILTLYGKPIHNAVATSAGLGVSITVAGALGFILAGLSHQALMPPLTIGYVSLIGFALMAPLSSYTAGFGARFAHKLPPRRLEIAFGIFMLLMSVRFLASAVWRHGAL
jgi:uncharacterized membrane protein YfcA